MQFTVKSLFGGRSQKQGKRFRLVLTQMNRPDASLQSIIYPVQLTSKNLLHHIPVHWGKSSQFFVCFLEMARTVIGEDQELFIGNHSFAVPFVAPADEFEVAVVVNVDEPRILL